MATSANAAAVLSFGVGGPGIKSATNPTSTTTTLTAVATAPLSGGFPVNITTIGNVVLNPLQTINARETFVNVTSSGAATNVGGVISQAFGGTITYLDPSNPAINYLTITFTNAVLRGTAGGQAVNLVGDTTTGTSITFTSNDPGGRVQQFINDPVKQFDIGLTGLSSNLAVANGTIQPFTSINEAGNVSSFPIPEPSSVVMASTAVLAGLGCFGWRRSRSKSL